MYNKALTDKIVNELEEKGTALQDAIQYEIKLRERSFVNDDRDDIPEGFFKEMQIEEFIEFVADNKEQINISTWEDLKDLLHMELVVNKPYVSNVNSSVEDMLEELEVLIEKMAKTEDFNSLKATVTNGFSLMVASLEVINQQNRVKNLEDMLLSL